MFLLFLLQKKIKKNQQSLEGYQGTIPFQPKEQAFSEWCNQYGQEVTAFGLGWSV